MKPTATLDIECFRNYFLVMFRNVVTGGVRHFEMYPGIELDRMGIQKVLGTYRIVTFNGMDYDLPMLTLALTGVDCPALKRASDSIIQGKLRGWQFECVNNIKVSNRIDHIDLKEVAPGVMISLKQYGGRMHSKKLQDLPYAHDADITPAMRPVIVDYCGNDHFLTADLWFKLTTGKDDVIGIRETIGAETGMDLRSKSDAQTAEAVMRKTIEKMLGRDIKKAEIPAGTSYKYVPPAFLKFESPELQQLLRDVSVADFIVMADGKIAEPPTLKGRKVTMGESTYSLGIGGLHSNEKKAAHFADDNTLLLDRDVASFYPMLILMCGLFPLNMGPAFLKVFKSWIDRRIAAKRMGNKTLAQTLKIFLNGIFGKLGSWFSIVYAPHLLIQVTLTGQLVLLMLIERFEKASIRCVSANTDGIVSRCPKALYPIMLAIIAQWEKETGLETEETRYSALFSRDVNNYVALKAGGGSKTKGVFTEPSLSKNVENEICNDAATAFLEHGTPPELTIRSCRDIRKFLTMRQVDGGGMLMGAPEVPAHVSREELLQSSGFDREADGRKVRWCKNENVYTTGEAYKRALGMYPSSDRKYLGKVVRWYVGMDLDRDIRRFKPSENGTFGKVAGSAGAVPMMELTDSLPLDLNLDAYLTETDEILASLGVTPTVKARLARQFPNPELFVEEDLFA